MRLPFFLSLFILFGCSSKPADRRPASVIEIVNHSVDPSTSKVQIFPAQANQDGVWYYFYVQLKNTEGQFIDSDEIELKTNSGENIEFQLERTLPGKYYIIIKKRAGLSSAQLNLFVQGKPLREEFKLSFDYPSRKKSKIVLVEKSLHQNTYRLHLQNENGEHVAIKEKPEIYLEGLGVVEEPHLISDGVWEFSVTYPEQNTIMYFSVRAMGVFLPKLFRYQHVEK